jgi:hypothetical protein
MTFSNEKLEYDPSAGNTILDYQVSPIRTVPFGQMTFALKHKSWECYRGKYHCTVDLLFDWFGLVCFANKKKNCQLPYS